MLMKMFRFLTKDELKKLNNKEIITNNKPIVFYPYYPYTVFNILDFMKLINDGIIEDRNNHYNTLCINKMDYLISVVPKSKDFIRRNIGICCDNFNIYDRDDLDKSVRTVKRMLDLDEEVVYHYYTMNEYGLHNVWLHDIIDISSLKNNSLTYDRITYRRCLGRDIPKSYFLQIDKVIENL